MTTTHPSQPLADQMVAGFRALADTIANNPQLAEYLRYANFNQLLVSTTGEADKPKLMAEFIRAGKANGATISKSGDEKWFNLDITWGPIGLHVFAAREDVCERVVTGVETVTKTVPDPALLAAVPQVEVTEQVETVEWVCRPLLAETAPQ